MKILQYQQTKKETNLSLESGYHDLVEIVGEVMMMMDSSVNAEMLILRNENETPLEMHRKTVDDFLGTGPGTWENVVVVHPVKVEY